MRARGKAPGVPIWLNDPKRSRLPRTRALTNRLTVARAARSIRAGRWFGSGARREGQEGNTRQGRQTAKGYVCSPRRSNDDVAARQPFQMPHAEPQLPAPLPCERPRDELADADLRSLVIRQGGFAVFERRPKTFKVFLRITVA